jgi:hypothetical protein
LFLSGICHHNEKLTQSLFSTCNEGGRASSKGNLCPASRQIRENREFPASVDPQFHLALNNSYAKVIYFGVAYSNLLQKQIKVRNFSHCPFGGRKELC